jgi:sugar phosphate permease
MSGAKPEATGLASGLVNISYQIGSALGLAAIVAIASGVTSNYVSQDASSVEALNNGFQAAFKGAAIISGIATLFALFAIKAKIQPN